MINLYLLGLKGFSALKGLEESNLLNINEVIVGRDNNVKNDYANDIINFCQRRNIKWKERNCAENNGNFKIAIGWRWLIKDTKNLIVFHDSILPKYRGFNPLVSALINGDSQIGVTALQAAEDYDTGAIISQETIEISYPVKIQEAIELTSNLYISILNKVIKKILSNNLEGEPQDESKATYSLWRDEDDYYIDWNLSSEEIKRSIDALGYPYKGACTNLNGKLVRILDAKCIDDVKIENRTAGKVIFKRGDSFVIVCGSGLLEVDSFYDEEDKLIDLTSKFRLRFQ